MTFTQLPQNQPRTLTFEDYLTHIPDAEGRYELVDGTLVTMPPPTWLHLLIAKFLVNQFDAAIAQLGQDWTVLYEPGQRTGESAARLPDVAVIPLAAIQDFQSSAVLTVPAPLVVEIVSGNWRDDYLTKLAEYEALGIPEFWIVDYLGIGGPPNAQRYKDLLPPPIPIHNPANPDCQPASIAKPP